jgi:hypothetical protein
MLSKEEAAELKALEEKYGSKDSWLESAGRTAAQIPRGLTAAPSAFMDLLTLPIKGYDLLRGQTPHSYTEDYLKGYDKRWPGSKPQTGLQRGASAFASDVALLPLTGGLGSVMSGIKGVRKVGQFLKSIGAKNRSNIGSTVGASLASSAALEAAHRDENPGKTPWGVFPASIAGSIVGRKVAHGLKHPPKLALKEADELVQKTANKYHQNQSDLYRSLTDPIKSELDKTPHISFDGAIQSLIHKYQKIKDSALQESFLLSEEGEALKNLLRLSPKTKFSVFKNIVDNGAHGFSAKKVTHEAAKHVKHENTKAIARLGGYGHGADQASVPLKKINNTIKDSISEGVQSALGKDARQTWDTAKKNWHLYKKEKHPLVVDVTENSHIVGGPYKASIAKIKEGATHANFILDHLDEADKTAYAARVLKDRGYKNPLIALEKQHGKLSSLLSSFKERPVELQNLYKHATGYAKKSDVFKSYLPNKRDLARLHTLSPDEEEELRLLEEKYGNQ